MIGFLTPAMAGLILSVEILVGMIVNMLNIWIFSQLLLCSVYVRNQNLF